MDFQAIQQTIPIPLCLETLTAEVRMQDAQPRTVGDPRPVPLQPSGATPLTDGDHAPSVQGRNGIHGTPCRLPGTKVEPLLCPRECLRIEDLFGILWSLDAGMQKDR